MEGVTKVLLLLFTVFTTSLSLRTELLSDKPVNSAANYEYKTMYFPTQVDHFSFANNDVYKMRYLMADQFWDGDGGPIFFYTGNEGDIAWFCNNTGIMWEWAPEFKAMLVFAEHRYYGESMPYGKDSYKSPKYSGFLTAEQALADYAELILYIKKTVKGAANSPVISFGGSYGGMLSSWFRIKYPHIVNGALAASAPIWQFQGLTPCTTYFDTSSRVYENTNKQCAKNIQRSWKVLDDIGATGAGKKYLTSQFRLCDSLKDVEVLKAWLNSAWTYLAMVNYPYPAKFLEPLPGWPIKVVCSHLSFPLLDKKALLGGIFDAISVYHNYSGQASCFNLTQEASSDLGDLGWNYQSCTEMVMPLCSDGVHDIFTKSPWNLTNVIENCKKNYQLTPRPDWIKTVFGGKNITTASNIIFSNGLLDPWSGGGVLESLSESLVAIVIAEGAHHLDLRASNPADPPSVIDARNQEKAIIMQWIINSLKTQPRQ